MSVDKKIYLKGYVLYSSTAFHKITKKFRLSIFLKENVAEWEAKSGLGGGEKISVLSVQNLLFFSYILVWKISVKCFLLWVFHYSILSMNSSKITAFGSKMPACLLCIVLRFYSKRWHIEKTCLTSSLVFCHFQNMNVLS